jgi:hypothetical protein
LTIDSLVPAAEATISDGDNYSFDVIYFISDADFDTSSTYELQVYLSGDGNSTYIDCGYSQIQIAASGEGSKTITGQLLFAPGHVAPWTVYVDLYRNPAQSGIPFESDSETITYN